MKKLINNNVAVLVLALFVLGACDDDAQIYKSSSSDNNIGVEVKAILDIIKEEAKEIVDIVKEEAKDAADIIKEETKDAADIIKEETKDAADIAKKEFKDSLREEISSIIKEIFPKQ